LALGEKVEGASLGEPSRGFSLLELMLSVGLLAVVLLFVIASFTSLLRGGRKSADLTAANFIADALIQKMQADSNFLQSALSGTIYGAEQGQRQKDLNNVVYDYSVTADQIQVSSSPLQNLYQVNVEVWWWGNQAQKKLGYGKLYTRLTRIFYESQSS
jgi:prepilin-type N-terminal cleavage/methylation domain-containing protein